MALDFPASPTTGQQFNDWVFDGTAWRFAQTLPGGLPAGAIMPWAGASAPVNWLLCDGSAVSRTTYASLFSVVGTTYGAGDGTSTFNVPDLRGRVPVGRNGGTFGTLGATGGAETHTLDVTQIPSHNHGGSTSTTGAHTHSLSGSNAGATNLGPSVTSNSNGDFGYLLNGGRANSAGDHSHTIASQGGGQAHNNLQPYQVVNYVIKATAAVTPGESELAGRVGSVESVNTTQNSRLTSLETANATTNKSGLVPIVPTLVSVNAGTGSVSADGVISFTGGNTITLSGVFSSAYSTYKLLINSQADAGGADVWFQFRNSGGALTTGYNFTRLNLQNSAVSGSSSVSQNSWNLGRTNGYGGTSIDATLYDPGKTVTASNGYRKYLSNSTDAVFTEQLGGVSGITGTYTDCVIFLTSPQTFGTARIQFYGYR